MSEIDILLLNIYYNMEVRCHIRSRMSENLPQPLREVIRECIERVMQQSLQPFNHNLVYIEDVDKADVILDIDVSTGNPFAHIIPAFDYNQNKCYISVSLCISIAPLPDHFSLHLFYMRKNNILLSYAICKTIFTIYKFIGIINEQDMLNLYAGASYYLRQFLTNTYNSNKDKNDNVTSIFNSGPLFAVIIDPYKIYQKYLTMRDDIMKQVEKLKRMQDNNTPP